MICFLELWRCLSPWTDPAWVRELLLRMEPRRETPMEMYRYSRMPEGKRKKVMKESSCIG